MGTDSTGEPHAPAISVVVPVYNSAETLGALVRRLHDTLAAAASAHEIVLVDDGSRDDSWAKIEELAAADPLVRGFRHSRNYGQHNALLTGVRAARHELIVTLDDDLQNPPEEIPAMLRAMTPDVDVVYGSRDLERHGLFRNLASRLTKVALRSAMGADVAGQVTAFRVFRTKLREAFEHYRGPFVALDVLLSWGTVRFTSVVVRHDPRGVGRSNYTLAKLVGHAFNMLFGFSVSPLRLASWLGFATMGLGFGVLCWVFGRYFWIGESVPGFPFLASIVTIFAGTQLFTLGVIGEYLARLYISSQGRPGSFVRASTASASEPEGGSGDE